MRNARRLLVGVLVLLGVGAGVLAVHPQIGVLAAEGFPDEVWPASGQFVTVEGAPRDLPRRMRKLPDDAIARFDASEGRALLVVQGGTLIGEHYADGYGRNARLNSFSLVKSLVGALTARAVADGLISLDDPISRFVPELGRSNESSTNEASVRDVLLMRSGLRLQPTAAKEASGVGPKSLDDAAFSPFGALARVHAFGPDVLTDVLDDANDGPGAFSYQSANTALLGMVLEAVYDAPLERVLSDLIWKPAGAGDAHWRRYPRDPRATAYCCLYATPMDWARAGSFLLANGTPDERFLPDDVWREFVLPDLGVERAKGVYGWHLRHDVLDREGAAIAGPFAYLMGHGGQTVYLLPQQNAVVVRFGRTPQLLHSTLYELAPLLRTTDS